MAKRKKQPRKRGKKPSGIRPSKTWESKAGLKFQRFKLRDGSQREADRVLAAIKKKYPRKRFLAYGQMDFKQSGKRKRLTNNTELHDPHSAETSEDIAEELEELSIAPSPSELEIEIESFYVAITFAR